MSFPPVNREYFLSFIRQTLTWHTTRYIVLALRTRDNILKGENETAVKQVAHNGKETTHFGSVQLSHHSVRKHMDLWLALIRAEVHYLGSFYCTSNKKYNSIKLPLYVEQHNSPRIQYKQSLLLDENKILKKSDENGDCK